MPTIKNPVKGHPQAKMERSVGKADRRPKDPGAMVGTTALAAVAQITNFHAPEKRSAQLVVIVRPSGGSLFRRITRALDRVQKLRCAERLL
jgi:hypothetical protein